MFRLIPVSCIRTSAVRIESGMLIAATSVERRLTEEQEDRGHREQGPEAALAEQAVCDSLMNDDWSETLVIVIWPGWAAPMAASLAWTASATWTVLADDVLVTVRVSAGWPSVRAKPVVATPVSATVPTSPSRTAVGATGAADG